MTGFRQYPKDGLVPVDDLIKPYAEIIEEITAECTIGLVCELGHWEMGSPAGYSHDAPYDPPARTIPKDGLSLHDSAKVTGVEGWPTEVEQVLLAVFRLGMEQGIRLLCLKNQELLAEFANAGMSPEAAAEATRVVLLQRSLDQALVTTLE